MHRSLYPDGRSSILEAYSTRILVGLLASLAVVTVAVNVPVLRTPDRVGWATNGADRPEERIALQDIEREPTEEAPTSIDGAPPPTGLQRTPEPKPTQPEVISEPNRKGEEPDAERSASESTVQRMASLDPSDREPAIVGGMGNLYVSIEYPEKAREEGIEGKLKLEFTVQPDGSVRRVEVVKPLHPLCDSAAVEGVRSVEFVPAKHNGRPVPVRMRLPIQFRLITYPSLPSTAGKSS